MQLIPRGQEYSITDITLKLPFAASAGEMGKAGGNPGRADKSKNELATAAKANVEADVAGEDHFSLRVGKPPIDITIFREDKVHVLSRSPPPSPPRTPTVAP
jgi:hypothetical protein